ncbi:hypothetical protein [Metabacillus hrfriensis]|uniref:Uncharacterized protein n=1 Tax=Metabacillus hrfriensis TaxID=3048891 RepID=A0ACD4RG47_9BACI|nr:hypothetical protein [Metabacillus sp. CT-WN-B3]UAL53947.1 hypothetical protein K8L98_09315 [Metabacillus dongyingensis]UOK59339.1 hypothetical protein MGI18_10890 [Bacillus sp. OVS6]USK30261.1 hypothetical protein LIT32_09210 [Bacillus sp. CMF21]WHZ59510.1 hypothetical protein QLQ22_09350 [Metabacillus sp. CT-WN-B3]
MSSFESSLAPSMKTIRSENRKTVFLKRVLHKKDGCISEEVHQHSLSSDEFGV